MTTTHRRHGLKGYLEDQREFFDRIVTEDWDAHVGIPKWDQVRKEEVGHILGILPVSPERILDVGCGCGYHDVWFAEAQGIKEVVGIDYSSKSVEQANRHYPHPKVKRETFDIFDTPPLVRSLGKFDLVVAINVLEHLKDPVRFLMACRDCLNPLGYIGVVTPNLDCLTNLLRRRAGRPKMLLDPLHFAEYNLSQVEAMADRANLACRGRFGISCSMNVKGWNVLKPISFMLGTILKRAPRIGDIIGMVFQAK